MKKNLFFLFCLFPFLLQAQFEQKGIVLEINSKKHPVADVQICIKKSQPDYSGSDGLFQFTVQGAEPGDRISVDSILKPDYAVVNRDEISRWAITNDSYPWPHLIEVVHKDSLEIWKDQYLSQAEYFSKRELEKQVAALKLKLNKGEESQENYLKKIDQFQEENNRLQFQLNDLAERFAYINRDFALPFVNKALDAYREGKIDEAIHLLNTMDIAKELEIADQNLKLAQKELARVQDQKGRWVEAAMVLARIYSNKSNVDSANFYFGKAVFYDSTNYGNITEYAAFLEKRMLNYEKALLYYTIAFTLAHSDLDKAFVQNQIGMLKKHLDYSFEEISAHYQKALAFVFSDNTIDLNEDRIASSIFTNLGELQKQIHRYKDAEENFLFGVHSTQKIIELTNNNFDKLQYAQKLTSLGDLRIKMKKFKPAEKNLTDALRFYRSIHLSDSLSYYNDFIRTLNVLGGLYLEQNDATKAEPLISDAVTKSKACLKTDSLMYLSVFAESLDMMGQCKTQLNDSASAEISFKESLSITERLGISHSVIYKPLLALILNDYAIFQCTLNHFQLAEKYFENAIHIIREFAQNKPEVYSIDLIEVLNELSSLFLQTHQYQKAEGVLLESLFLCYQLQYYWKANFEVELVDIYRRLSDLAIHYKNSEEAKIYLNEALFYCDASINIGLTEFNVEKERIVNELSQLRNIKKKPLPIANTSEGNVNDANADDSLNRANWLGSLSYFLILEQNFSTAEYFAVKALQQSPEQSWIKANLALSLLLQDNYEAAKKIYIELKDQRYPLIPRKTFKDIFLNDFDEIEMKGITHPDIIKMRILLSNS